MSNCKNCLFIRYFLVSVIIIVLTALIFTENLKYLSFVTPTLLSYLIILLGVIVFIIKVLAHYKKKLSIFNKPNKVRNMTRKSSKSMSRKKIN
jgi:disulfide bond formation protein DsbB